LIPASSRQPDPDKSAAKTRDERRGLETFRHFAQRVGGESKRSAMSSIAISLLTTGMGAQPKTAWKTFNEGNGVCRDYAHLAIAFCGAMNIPTRYGTDYLGASGIMVRIRDRRWSGS